jgi:hypothetical protein
MHRPVPQLSCVLVGLFLASLSASACSNSGSNTPTAPTPPAPVAITETFEGTLTVNGAATFPFAAQRSGNMAAQLTVLNPDNPDEATTVGLSLGTWNGLSCQTVLANDAAVLNSLVIGQAQTAANFCVRIYDVGRLTAAVPYQIVVTHSS